MRTIQSELQPGQAVAYFMQARYFRVMEAYHPLTVRIFKENRVIEVAEGVEVGFYTLPPDGFDRIEIESANAQSVKWAITNGYGGYDRIAGYVRLLDTGNVRVIGTADVQVIGTAEVEVQGTASVRELLPATLSHKAELTVGTAAVAVVTAAANRRALRLMNAGTTTIYLGSAGVTVANAAMVLVPGAYLDETTAPGAAWHAIGSAAGGKLRIMEVME